MNRDVSISHLCGHVGAVMTKKNKITDEKLNKLLPSESDRVKESEMFVTGSF